MRILFALISNAVDKLQAAWPPNRIAVAVGLLCTPVLSAASIWLNAHLGAEIPPYIPVAVVIATTASAVTLLYKFIDGCQKDEARRFGSAPVDGKQLEEAIEKAVLKALASH